MTRYLRWCIHISFLRSSMELRSMVSHRLFLISSPACTDCSDRNRRSLCFYCDREAGSLVWGLDGRCHFYVCTRLLPKFAEGRRRLNAQKVVYFWQYDRIALLLLRTTWWDVCLFWFRWSEWAGWYFVELDDIGVAQYLEDADLASYSLDVCLLYYLLLLQGFYRHSLTGEQMSA